MTRISLSTAFVASLLASSALAAPQKRVDVPGNDNGACAATFGRCVKAVKKAGAHVFFDNPFGFSDQCTIAAVCYDANVDDFLYDVYRQVPHGRRRRPYSKTSPRLTQTQYNRIAYSPIHKRELEARALATQQNFVDYFYTTLSRSGGPYPDIDYVTNLWSEISAWTGFCDSRSIPYGNLADWFQYYSSSNYSPMCGAKTSTSVTGGTTTVNGGTTSVTGGTTTVNGGTTTVNSGTTTVVGGTTSVIGGTTVTVTGSPVVSTFTTTLAGTTVTTTNANGNTITTTASPTTVTVTTTATTTGTAATASPSNFVVTDGTGNPVGYLSTTGTITQNPNDALTPQSAGTSAKRQTTLIDLFSAGTNNFFCGRGDDLSGQTSYIRSSGCPTSTGAGANHTAFGYETTIFSIDSTGQLSVFWVNNDGMTLPVTLTMGTLNGIAQTLLFVLDAAAPVFDGNVAGTPLTAKGRNVDEQASTFSSSMASSSSVPLSSAMSSMLSSLLPTGTDSSLLPSMTSLNMSATSLLPSGTDSSLLPSVTSLNVSATSILPSTSDVLPGSSASQSSSATASSSSSAPSATASVLAATDANGNVVGYFSVDGTLTQDPSNALSPMAAQSAPSKRWNLFGNARRATDQLVNLFSQNTNNYLCGIGGDLTDDNSIATGGCDTTTFIGQTSEATGYETAIFSIVNGGLQALWVNSDGTSIDPVTFTYGTLNNVSNTLLFVKNAAAPVFDNGASGATVTAMAMPAPANDTTSSTDAASSTSASIAPSSSVEASSSSAAEASSSSAAEASSSSTEASSSSVASEASSSSAAEASSSSAAEASSSSAAEDSSSSAAEASSTSAAAEASSSSAAEASSSSAAEASSSSAAEASSTSAAAEASSSSAAEESSSSASEASSSSAAEASSSSAAEASSSSAAEASSSSAAEASSSSAAEASSSSVAEASSSSAAEASSSSAAEASSSSAAEASSSSAAEATSTA